MEIHILCRVGNSFVEMFLSCEIFVPLIHFLFIFSVASLNKQLQLVQHVVLHEQFSLRCTEMHWNIEVKIFF